MDTPQTENPALSAPSVEEATLVFLNGADQLHLLVDPAQSQLCQTTFDGPQPTVRQTGNVIEIDNRRDPHPLDWRRQTADVRLSPTVAWRIVIRGGLAHLRGDLLGLQLAGLDIEGGASRIDLRVDRATGGVPIRVAGGAEHVAVVRHGGSAASLSIGGGAVQLTLDRQQLGTVGGSIRLETPEYTRTADRFDVRVEGGAVAVAVTAE